MPIAEYIWYAEVEHPDDEPAGDPPPDVEEATDILSDLTADGFEAPVDYSAAAASREPQDHAWTRSVMWF